MVYILMYTKNHNSHRAVSVTVLLTHQVFGGLQREWPPHHSPSETRPVAPDQGSLTPTEEGETYAVACFLFLWCIISDREK